MKDFGINRKPLVLIVDDIPKNLQLLGISLYESGCEVAMAESGRAAIESVADSKPDLILLDINMPEMDGLEVCDRLKKMDHSKDIPIIFLTAKTDKETILEGFKLGGVDYITKPFFPEELMARIGTHLELKFSRDLINQKAEEIAKVNKALVKTNEEKTRYLARLNEDLEIAADYVQSLLPERLTEGKIKSNWIFAPSARLGGDAFGYDMINEDAFAVYLVDVSGHGIGPALHSVSILNDLKFRSLAGVDYCKPEQVLSSLNNIYRMDEHSGMYFTVWYGVFNFKTGELTYSNAGHPPALLVDSQGVRELESFNMIVGFMPESPYSSRKVKPQESFSLYVYSDGLFDFNKTNGDIWTKDDLIEFIKKTDVSAKDEIERLYEKMKKIADGKDFEDDFSILKIEFELEKKPITITEE